MDNVATKQALRESLLGISMQGPAARHCGICYNVGVPESAEILAGLFETWPEYSENPDYPVPSPDPAKSPQQMYDSTRDLWVGEYGKLRYDLLSHCIEELGRELTARGVNKRVQQEASDDVQRTRG